ncbi:site-2 protease family protein [Coraliomargarita algicola]|uniref:Site-2 protease family protein n=1 Tax=Coraliomargarita algicola TaxID=3092156 RepID=A0ABZ0RIZ5_9BACT|nr:site-2 protease family protein [Coraliomargarita sp. J2-16]WPJ95048.1 site-2 protease family protein [Coraliomargarita sp. J2-16]
MIHFTIFGIPVRIEPWFWITMALIGGGLNAANSLDMLLVLVFIFAAFLSILIHELGHALTIRKFGLPTSITLQSFGGFAAYPAGRLSRLQSFVVTAAGPAVQFALGVLLILLARYLVIPEGSLFGPFLHDLIWVSIAWSILNCLPIYPLDGGQMVAAVLGPQRQRYVHLLSVVVAVLIGLAGYFFLGTILLSVFMGLFAWQNWQAYQAVR